MNFFQSMIMPMAMTASIGSYAMANGLHETDIENCKASFSVQHEKRQMAESERYELGLQRAVCKNNKKYLEAVLMQKCDMLQGKMKVTDNEKVCETRYGALSVKMLDVTDLYQD